jgi:hypothetical protein
MSRFPLGLRLYLPESCARDAERRKKVGVSGEIGFRPKWCKEALRMDLDAVIDEHRFVPHRNRGIGELATQLKEQICKTRFSRSPTNSGLEPRSPDTFAMLPPTSVRPFVSADERNCRAVDELRPLRRDVVPLDRSRRCAGNRPGGGASPAQLASARACGRHLSR